MLNKKGLFERALLVNFVAMVACASSMVVASDNTQTEKQNQNKQIKQYAEPEKIEGIMNARNQLNQMYWRIKARTMRKAPKLKESHQWIKQPQYAKSIEYVIGEAIADRITNKNEFTGKSDNDVIIFDELTKPETYTQANWNAVVLYNFINQIYWNYLSQYKDPSNYANKWKSEAKTIFSKLKPTIISSYSTYFQTKGLQDKLDKLDKLENLQTQIHNAITVIKRYVTALETMPDYIWQMFNAALSYKTYPETCMCPNFVMNDNKKQGNLQTRLNLGFCEILIPLKCTYDDTQSKLYYKVLTNDLEQSFMRHKLDSKKKEPAYSEISLLLDGLY